MAARFLQGRAVLRGLLHQLVLWGQAVPGRLFPPLVPEGLQGRAVLRVLLHQLVLRGRVIPGRLFPPLVPECLQGLAAQRGRLSRPVREAQGVLADLVSL